MKKIYFTVYYFLTLAITLFNMRTYFKLPFSGGFTSALLHGLFLLTPYLVVVLTTLGLFGYHKKIILFLTVFLLSLYTTIPHIAFGKINHTMHAFIYGSICLLFLNAKKPLNEKSNKTVLRVAQALILSTYFSAGLAKAFAFAQAQNPWRELIGAPTEHLAYAIGEGNGPHFLLYELIQNPLAPLFLAFGFFLIILFELSAIVPIFKTSLMKHYGLAVITFHVLCSIALGIWFIEAILASAFFFIFTENLESQLNEQRP